MSESYDMIDKFLRNNLGDEEYSLYSKALDEVFSGKGKPVAQFRTEHCADWYDGYPDHSDGGGPYEIRTLYASPQPADPANPDWCEGCNPDNCSAGCGREVIEGRKKRTEPVAWRYRNSPKDVWTLVSERPSGIPPSGEVEPLYTEKLACDMGESGEHPFVSISLRQLLKERSEERVRRAKGEYVLPRPIHHNPSPEYDRPATPPSPPTLEETKPRAFKDRFGFTVPCDPDDDLSDMSTSIPEGWQLVPKEPTEEMLDGVRQFFSFDDTAEVVYKNMLKAAPKFGEGNGN